MRPAITESFVQARCADGASMALHTYAGGGHFEVRTTSAPLVAGWVLDRLQGEPAPTGCRTTAD